MSHIDLPGLIAAICGSQHVYTNAEELYPYGMDQTMDLHYPFDILVKPASAEEISGVLRLCNAYGVPLTPRGGGSGVTGGALPVSGGVVLSMERLNKVLSINSLDGFVMAEAGVVTADLCQAVREKGWYLPVEPTSSSISFIGGNIASNAGSINSCKYGKAGEYVLNLEVVLPTGEIIWTGSNLRKNSVGPNLTQLFVGSEGMLGVITKVVCRLLAPPPHETLVLAAFRDIDDSCCAIRDMREAGLLLSAVEYIGEGALRLTRRFLDGILPLADECFAAHLLVGLERGPGEENNLDKVCYILGKYTANDILVGESHAEKEALRRLRLHIGAAMTGDNRKYRDVDVCVPLSFLCRYLTKVAEIAKDSGVTIACFGHALDGNIHTMLVSDRTVDNDEEKFSRIAHKIYEYASAVGGVISGEHGVGLLQKEYIGLQFSEARLCLLGNLKRLFDPKGILNPGKFFA
jgi:glycolate oxidase